MIYEGFDFKHPDYSAVFQQDIHPEFHGQYARAREAQAEHFADEITLIADDGRNDFMEKVRQNGETFVDANREHLDF